APWPAREAGSSGSDRPVNAGATKVERAGVSTDGAEPGAGARRSIRRAVGPLVGEVTSRRV
ncbi:MAG TPA: hypothetical protein VF363_05125, partial [Candidatus Eisenbacteria bacterium]